MFIWLGLTPRTTAMAFRRLTMRLRLIRVRTSDAKRAGIARPAARVPGSVPLGSASFPAVPPDRPRG
ncbi:MAG: hypothetical protein AB7P52_18275 [Alphaproteobacteria bacterium]